MESRPPPAALAPAVRSEDTRQSMRLLAGTSGFSYAPWKGTFYPADLPASRMLAHYAERLPAVEVNNTFYRMPTRSLLTGWAQKVPASFRFAIKAPRRITHQRRLKDVGDDMAFFLQQLALLEERLGAILFQLPPTMRADRERLAGFLEHLPSGTRAAFEFRHPSWDEEEVHRLLAERSFARVAADVDDQPEPELPVPAAGGRGEGRGREDAGWGYLRLRRSLYRPEDLERWAVRLERTGWSEACVFFKHEDAGVGPELARTLLARLGGN